MSQHLFFDLDHTLWDFETNAAECLEEIHETFLSQKVEKNIFLKSFSEVNRNLWQQLERKDITHDFLRINRFKMTLEKVNVSSTPTEGEAMNDLFLKLLPEKKHLMPHTLEVLDFCSQRFPLHIISNGFYNVQIGKMKNSGIYHYFEHIVTNEVAGARKPDPKIFEHTLQLAKIKNDKAIMIGDSYEADIEGAEKSGIKAIYYAPQNHENHHTHIDSLLQLKEIL